MKIVVIGYYELRESIWKATRALARLGYTIVGYPLFQYAYDRFDKRSDYADNLSTFLVKEKPEIVLWWFLNVPVKVFSQAKEAYTKATWVMFNWDDPWMWLEPHSRINEKAKYFDLVVPTCKATCTKYLECGAKKAVYHVPGFSSKIHFPLELFNDDDEKRYQCDISFCCTNLYTTSEFKDQFIPRKEIVDALERSPDIRFFLYGPEFLAEIYPRSYRGYCAYSETNKVFNYSKICLCTHVCSNYDGYVNERTILILGSGGLLLVDPVTGMKDVVTDEEVIFLERTTYLSQIRNILANYESFRPKRMAAAKRAKESYTWDHWAKCIVNELPETCKVRDDTFMDRHIRDINGGFEFLFTGAYDEGVNILQNALERDPSMDCKKMLDAYLSNRIDS